MNERKMNLKEVINAGIAFKKMCDGFEFLNGITYTC